MKRPSKFDTVLRENRHAYASYTSIGGNWMGGLFAKHDLPKGTVIARYVGKEYHPASDADGVKDQSYMFVARMVQDGRKRVVIDGNPEFYSNLAGYANYANMRSANAQFVDDAAKARAEDRDVQTYVTLQAGEFIPEGTEIRVDYDVGSSTNPFRDQMIANGVPPSALKGRSYADVRWMYPKTHLGPGDSAPSPSKSAKVSPKKKKRPPGRPPKGKVWDPQHGYVSL